MQFGIPPTAYRNKEHAEINAIPKSLVVERDIVNFGGVLTVHLEAINLQGTYLEVMKTTRSLNKR